MVNDDSGTRQECLLLPLSFNTVLEVLTRVMIFPGGASGKEPVCQCRRHKKCGFDP